MVRSAVVTAPAAICAVVTAPVPSLREVTAPFWMARVVTASFARALAVTEFATETLPFGPWGPAGTFVCVTIPFTRISDRKCQRAPRRLCSYPLAVTTASSTGFATTLDSSMQMHREGWRSV